jgi:hypothetical protein
MSYNNKKQNNHNDALPSREATRTGAGDGQNSTRPHTSPNNNPNLKSQCPGKSSQVTGERNDTGGQTAAYVNAKVHNEEKAVEEFKKQLVRAFGTNNIDLSIALVKQVLNATPVVAPDFMMLPGAIFDAIAELNCRDAGDEFLVAQLLVIHNHSMAAFTRARSTTNQGVLIVETHLGMDLHKCFVKTLESLLRRKNMAKEKREKHEVNVKPMPFDKVRPDSRGVIRDKSNANSMFKRVQ